MMSLRENPHRSCKKQRVGDDSITVGDQPFLPVDLLCMSFEYVDVGDIPSVARTSKCWADALRKVEETLWLTLVRKHHPIVEKATLLLPPSTASNGARLPSLPSSATGISGTVPPPSRSWKHQFKRRNMLLKMADHSAAVTSTAPTRTPAPISLYYIQVDLTLYSYEKNGKHKHVGLVSRIIEKPTFNDELGRIKFTVDELEELSLFEFSEVDITLILCDKSTGLQTIIYSGGHDATFDVDVNRFWFGSFTLTRDIFIGDMPGADEAEVLSELFLSKNGCVCNCSHGHGQDCLFVPPKTGSCDCGHVCTCCSCPEKWQCIRRAGVTVEVNIEFWIYDDVVELTENQQLELFERLEFT